MYFYKGRRGGELGAPLVVSSSFLLSSVLFSVLLSLLLSLLLVVRRDVGAAAVLDDGYLAGD